MKMDKSNKETLFRQTDRPEVALITNHGYGGPEIPVGGAPDTGGQNLYVNTLALKLDRIGYKVTIFARGGFPHYDSDRMRGNPEFLSDFVRYVYVPGGGDEFIIKEDIAIALDEEFEWLTKFISQEAEVRKCEPWEVYEFINSHYWDGAILGIRLIESWRNDWVANWLTRWLDGIVPADQIVPERQWKSLGEAPGFHLGWFLLNHGDPDNVPMKEKLGVAASRWAAKKKLSIHGKKFLVDSAEEVLSGLDDSLESTFQKLIVSDAFGRAVLTISPDIDEELQSNLDLIDRHVWTPHSLGELKNYNFRERPTDIRRDLKFCERRSHERMICNRTRAVAATSSKIAEYLWTQYRVPLKKTFYFPPCIDGLVFRPYADDESNDTYRYLSDISGIEADRLKAGSIVFETSRMDRSKRKDLLVTAFTEILPDFDDIYLFIGGGPGNDVFQALNDQLQNTEILDGRAFLTGSIPDKLIGPMFSVADIYASASEMEGFGMSVSQAASAGTPIVSSDLIPFCLNYVPEYVELFRAGDMKAFAEALRRLLNDEDKQKENSTHLRERAGVLDWEARTIAFVEYLRQAGMEIKT